MFCTRYFQSVLFLLEKSFQLAKNAYTIIQIAIEIDATDKFDIFIYSGKYKHIELDFCLYIYTNSRLVVDLPVFLSELRAQVYKIVRNIVASESLSVSKIKLVTQINLNKLQAD